MMEKPVETTTAQGRAVQPVTTTASTPAPATPATVSTTAQQNTTATSLEQGTTTPADTTTASRWSRWRRRPRTTASATPATLPTNAQQNTTAANLEQATTTPADAPTASIWSRWKLRNHRAPYPLHTSRWIIRAVTLLAEFIAFFIFIGLAAECSRDGGFCYRYFFLIFVGLPMLWNIAEFIALCINGKGIHPGAHIALDLIAFGFLIGPFSVLLVLVTPYAGGNDCTGSDCIDDGPSSRAVRDVASSIAGYVFVFIAGILHFVLFVLCCISVDKWRRVRREARVARFAQMQQAYRQGPMSIAGNMDPNMAYIVTYPDGRQVLVPPQGAAQQYPPMTRQHGFYAPQQHYAPYSAAQPQHPSTRVAPVPFGAPVSAPVSAPSSIPSVPPAAATTQQRGVAFAPPNNGRSGSPAMTQSSDPFRGSDSRGSHSAGSHPSSLSGHHHHDQQQQQQQQLDVPGQSRNRDSLYEPKSAIEGSSHGASSSLRPGEAM